MPTYADPARTHLDVTPELSAEPPADPGAVAASRPGARWWVQETAWGADLPADVTALLAPPVVVCASVPPPPRRGRRVPVI